MACPCVRYRVHRSVVLVISAETSSTARTAASRCLYFWTSFTTHHHDRCLVLERVQHVVESVVVALIRTTHAHPRLTHECCPSVESNAHNVVRFDLFPQLCSGLRRSHNQESTELVDLNSCPRSSPCPNRQASHVINTSQIVSVPSTNSGCWFDDTRLSCCSCVF